MLSIIVHNVAATHPHHVSVYGVVSPHVPSTFRYQVRLYHDSLPQPSHPERRKAGWEDTS